MEENQMSKGRALRMVGGFCMMFGLFGLLVPDGHIKANIMFMAIGCALTIFGFGQN